MRNTQGTRLFHVCSNRTFMELKYGLRIMRIMRSGCSNRTFMELKLLSDNVKTNFFIVLIVPLWN